MAVKKLSTNISLSLEVQNGTDDNGNPKYSKKSFSGVKSNSDPADVLAVGRAISEVLANDTDGCYLTETSLLATEE